MDNIEKEVSVEKDPSNQLIIEEIAEAFVENNLQRNIAVRESSIAGTSKVFAPIYGPLMLGKNPYINQQLNYHLYKMLMFSNGQRHNQRRKEVCQGLIKGSSTKANGSWGYCRMVSRISYNESWKGSRYNGWGLFTCSPNSAS